MNILAVDDERLALRGLEQAINEAIPKGNVAGFVSPALALLYAHQNPIDIAFIDIEMEELNGLELAKRLKDIYGNTRIVFSTGYSEYAIDAFNVSASGYILKPITSKAISDVLSRLQEPVSLVQSGITFQTFGSFEAFVSGKPLYFSRSKAKELLAYLVHKRGAAITVKELASVLFESRESDRSIQKNMQSIISNMMKTLHEAGVKDIIIKRYNSICVDTSKVNCDYYNFLKGDALAVNCYLGEYMSNYSWAEFMIGYLDRKIQLNK